jgi:LmbE family N-acetylglucosaminyl deacetylase
MTVDHASLQVKRTAVHISPHPDDEAIGAPATLLRMREMGWRVVSYYVGFGRPEQVARRRAEAQRACSVAGFEFRHPDQLVSISQVDDLDFAEDCIARLVAELIKEVSPQVVITCSPHDGHHGHEVTARAVLRAAAGIGRRCPKVWLWGLWGELPFPTLYSAVGSREMRKAIAVLNEYGEEIGRNDYASLLRVRARANAILGSERVFGFGSARASPKPYAELLTECVLVDRQWYLGSSRLLDLEVEPAIPTPRHAVSWWLDLPSVHKLARHSRL